MGQFSLDDLFDKQIIQVTEIENTTCVRKLTRSYSITNGDHVKKVFKYKATALFHPPMKLWTIGSEVVVW